MTFKGLFQPKPFCDSAILWSFWNILNTQEDKNLCGLYEPVYMERISVAFGCWYISKQELYFLQC